MVCAQIEAGVFPFLQEEFEKFVTVQLYTEHDRFKKMQLDKHDSVALPLYVVEAPDGTPLLQGGGTLNTPDKFRAWLEKGLRIAGSH